MADLDLFSSRLSRVRKRQRARSLGWQLVVGSVALFSLLMIIISSYSLVIARNNQSLTDRIGTAKNEVESLRGIETKQTYLISKISTFAELLSSQEKHQAIAEAVFALLPNGTSLKGFKVAEEGLITLSGSVPDYLTLLALLNRIQNSEQLNLPVVSAKVSSIGFGSQTGINFVIEVLISV